MRSLVRRARVPLAALTLGLLGLTACGGLSIAAGILGALGSGLLLVVALLSLTATQPGCTDSVCLSVLPDDAGLDGGTARPDRVGPCLTPPIDVGTDIDAGFGACLSAPAEVGPDAADGGRTDRDGAVGPCLSAPADVAWIGPAETHGVPRPDYVARGSRRATAERLGKLGVLPPDVVASLTDDDEEV